MLPARGGQIAPSVQVHLISGLWCISRCSRIARRSWVSARASLINEHYKGDVAASSSRRFFYHLARSSLAACSLADSTFRDFVLLLIFRLIIQLKLICLEDCREEWPKTKKTKIKTKQPSVISATVCGDAVEVENVMIDLE